MSIEVSLNNFNLRCDDLMKCKFIVSAQRISNLLKVLAADNEMFEFLASCMKDFNYDVEFTNAVVEMPSGVQFKLPFNKRRLIAFVTNLLYEFDNGKRRMVDFLQLYYPAKTVNESYVDFCEDVIVKYRDAVNAILTGAPDAEVTPEAVSQPVERLADIPEGAVMQVEYILRAINAMIMEDPMLDPSKKDDYLSIVDGMNYAMEMRDSRFVKSMYTAFSYAFETYRAVERKVSDVGACLKLYLII